MDIKEKFESAVERSRELPQKPSNEELLKLYSLYKQASEGDISGDRPGGFDFKGAAKYDSWQSLQGKDPQSSMEEYVQLVDNLFAKYN